VFLSRLVYLLFSGPAAVERGAWAWPRAFWASGRGMWKSFRRTPVYQNKQPTMASGSG